MNYFCPKCLNELNRENDVYSCGDCKSTWPVKEGIPVFLSQKNPLYYKHNHQKALELIKIARDKGWKEAVQRSKDSDFAGRFGGFHSKNKINWINLVKLKQDAKILDVGCGWGGLSFELSKRYAEVAAMDVTYERCLFNTLRAKQEELSNINFFCGGNMPNLPLPDNYFDLVYFNGVLEWIPLSQEGDPLQVQKQTLKEARRVLKSGGQVYIGIENRFGLNYLLGDPDPHTKLKYGNVLPRSLANVYSQLKQKRPFRTYTHSFIGWKKILTGCGFKEIKFFWPVPDYRKFTKTVPLDDKESLWKELESQIKHSGLKRAAISTMKRTLVNVGIYKHLPPCFSIVAQVKK